jgi:hypothetical protein
MVFLRCFACCHLFGLSFSSQKRADKCLNRWITSFETPPAKLKRLDDKQSKRAGARKGVTRLAVATNVLYLHVRYRSLPCRLIGQRTGPESFSWRMGPHIDGGGGEGRGGQKAFAQE